MVTKFIMPSYVTQKSISKQDASKPVVT